MESAEKSIGTRIVFNWKDSPLRAAFPFVSREASCFIRGSFLLDRVLQEVCQRTTPTQDCQIGRGMTESRKRITKNRLSRCVKAQVFQLIPPLEMLAQQLMP